MKDSKRYTYTCASCEGPVTKAPTAMSEDGKSTVHGLHGWKCDNCGNGIKVKRELRGK